jgi:ketol-acid reductoisomerase
LKPANTAKITKVNLSVFFKKNLEEIQNKIVKVTPNGDSAKRILAERAANQKKELELKRRWEEIRRLRVK